MANANRGNHGTGATVLRKLGINEAYQLAMYILDQYRGTVLSCRYKIPPHLAPTTSQTQLEEAVKAAVVETTMRHPMLQVGILNPASKTPSWIQLPSLDLTQHIQWLHPAAPDDFERTVQEAFCAQLDDHFPDLSIPQPHWKLTLIRQHNSPALEVVLTWNHAHFDAMGAKVIHSDLLASLSSPSPPPPTQNLLPLPPSPPPLPSPIESLRSLPVSPTHLLKALWSETRPQFLNRDPSWAAWCPILPSPSTPYLYKTQFRSFLLPNPSLLTLQSLCRQHSTTITALLNGLLLIAFSSRLDAPAFQSSTMVDHRRNLPADGEGGPWGGTDRAVGNYVTQCMHRYGESVVADIRSKLIPSPPPPGTTTPLPEARQLSTALEQQLWVISARNRQEIVDKLAAGLQNDLVGLFKYVTDWQKTMSGMAKRRRQFSWIVTNIGVMEGGGGGHHDDGSDREGKGWAITRAQFGLSTEVPAAAIEFSPVSVRGRGMCVGASWADCAVDVKLGEGIMGDLERWMGQLARRA